MGTRREPRASPPLGSCCVAALTLLATGCVPSILDDAPSSGDPGVGAQARAGEASAVLYAGVVRRLVLVDHGFGAAPTPYRVVYVIDGPVPGAADPMAPRSSRQPTAAFPAGVKDRIRGSVRERFVVVFVRDRDSVLAGKPPGRVGKHGVLITLGPIRWAGNGKAAIPANRYLTGLNGLWGTYRATRHGSGWRISPLGGSVAIS
jgi:hypothetical protein